MPDKKISTHPTVETITALRPAAKSKADAPDDARRRNRLKILALIGSLLLLTTGGGWLLHGLSENALPPPDAAGDHLPVKATAKETAPPAAAKPAPAAADPARPKLERPSAEQKRAETIETVRQLMASAGKHEKNGDLAGALAGYRQAVRIDPDARQARQGLNRVQHLLKEQQFQQLMSEGLAAVHAADYRAARSKLLKARQIKPESGEVADVLFQVDQALRLARIEKLGREARGAEQVEDWPRALKAYQAVLKIDANVQFAIRGKARAIELQRIFKGLDFFLANPRVLESDSQLGNAVLLLGEVEGVTPRGPELTARIGKLQQLVKTAQTPVKVVIESDNLTRVAVYRVGKLGRFSVHELQLRPGTYTVVGARDGYQDIRRRIVVQAGKPALRITIACRVKI